MNLINDREQIDGNKIKQTTLYFTTIKLLSPDIISDENSVSKGK